MNLDKLDNYDIRQFCQFNYLYVPIDETKLKPYVKSLRLSQDQKKELQTLIHWNRNTTIMVYSFLSLANLVFIKVYFDFLIYLEMPMFYSILVIMAFQCVMKLFFII